MVKRRERRARRRVGGVLVMGAALCAAGLLLATPAGAAPNQLGVRAVDDATGSSTQVGSGGTASWITTYENRSADPGQVQIDQTLGGAQEYVDSSLHVPDGWQVFASGDGSTYEARQPVPGDRNIRVTSTVAPGGTGKTVSLPRPSVFYVPPASTEGDGYVPILHRGRVFSIYHHKVAGPGGLINCVDKSTGQRCDGYPVSPSSQVGPAGQGPIDIGSVAGPNVYIDTSGAYGERGSMYFPAQRSGDFGIACFNLETNRNCGYTKLGDIGASTVSGAPQMWDGIEQAGAKLFGMAADGQMYCYDLDASAPCPGQPFRTAMLAYRPDPNKAVGLIAHHALVGGRVYTAVNYAGQSAGSLGARLHCFDPATLTDCDGWAAPKTVPGTPLRVISFNPLSVESGAASDVFEWRNTEGSTHGICVGGVKLDGVKITACFAPSGSLLSDPASPPGLFDGVPDRYAPQRQLQVGTRMYIPVIFVNPLGNEDTGMGICYDWTTQAQCDGFGSPQTWDGVPRGDTRDYGYAADGQCLWGLGDRGILWTFDAETGTDPCKTASSRVDIAPSSEFYCDGDPTHAKGWRNITLSGVNLGDFESLLVTVRDAQGRPIPGFVDRNLVAEAKTSLDISAIPIAANPELSVTAVANARSALSWDSGTPRLTVTFDGDPIQICFKTEVSAECSAGTVTDDVVATTQTAGTAAEVLESEAALNVYKTTECGVDIAVQKDKPQGDSDRAKPGEQVTFTIDVSANTPMGANGVKLEDPLPDKTLFVRASHGGAVADNLVTWPVFNLEGGQTLRLEVVLRVADDAPDKLRVHNVATASDDGSRGPDAAPDNNSDDDDTNVMSASDDPVDPPPDDDGRSGDGSSTGGSSDGGANTTNMSLPFTGGNVAILIQGAIVSMLLGTTILRTSGRGGVRQPAPPEPPSPPFPTAPTPNAGSRATTRRPGDPDTRPRHQRPY